MEETHSFVQILSWTAVCLLSISYWFQIWKIHIHKEVRDLSMLYHVFLAVGFGILAYTAWLEKSTIKTENEKIIKIILKLNDNKIKKIIEKY